MHWLGGHARLDQRPREARCLPINGPSRLYTVPVGSNLDCRAGSRKYYDVHDQYSKGGLRHHTISKVGNCSVVQVHSPQPPSTSQSQSNQIKSLCLCAAENAPFAHLVHSPNHLSLTNPEFQINTLCPPRGNSRTENKRRNFCFFEKW